MTPNRRGGLLFCRSQARARQLLERRPGVPKKARPGVHHQADPAGSGLEVASRWTRARLKLTPGPSSSPDCYRSAPSHRNHPRPRKTPGNSPPLNASPPGCNRSTPVSNSSLRSNTGVFSAPEAPKVPDYGRKKPPGVESRGLVELTGLVRRSSGEDCKSHEGGEQEP